LGIRINLPQEGVKLRLPQAIFGKPKVNLEGKGLSFLGTQGSLTPNCVNNL